MTTATVVALPRPTTPARRARHLARATRATRRQSFIATLAGGIAAVLVGLSLRHLAHGMEAMGVEDVEAWEMAVGIDCDYIALELLMVVAVSEAVRRKIAKHASPAVIGTLAGSSILNAVAFGIQASGWYLYPAALIGAVIPVLIYLTMRAASTAYLSRA